MKKNIGALTTLCLLYLTFSLHPMDWSVWQQVSKEAEKLAEATKKRIAEVTQSIEWAKTYPYWGKLQDLYSRGIIDTMDAEYAETTDKLTTIGPWNKNLITGYPKNIPGIERYIKVVSLMPEWVVTAIYEPAFKNNKGLFTTPIIKDVYLWVTIAPELKNFLETYKTTKQADDIENLFRIQQFLGLPPKPGNFYFVEMWVKPEDLFRPCADAEIIDTTCTVDIAPPSWMVMTHSNSFKAFEDIFNFVEATPEHQEWYKRKKDNSYLDGAKFPWTRMGYSYDWSEKNENHIGISEFAVKQGKLIEIISITPFDEA